MTRPNFFIGRHIDKETLRQLHAIQKLIKESAEGYVMTSRPHLTHVGSKFIVQRAIQLNDEDARKLISPLPVSAANELTLGVRGLKSVQGRRQKPYLVIDLEDSKGIFQRENYQINTRVQQGLGLKMPSLGIHIPPHVSIGKVFTENLTSELLEEAHSRLPESITFLPVSYPQCENDEALVEYRDLNIPNKIPKLFLDALRGQNPTND